MGKVYMNTVRHENGVEYLRSDKISSKHGFSTRKGGVSTLPHTSSLNLAFGRGDDKETVLENLRLFADAVGFDAEKTVSVRQVHSADVRYIDASFAGYGYFKEDTFSCDGYVTDVSGIVLGVKTADCVPIIMEGCGSDGGVRAVGAAHAGWRGTVSGIAASCFNMVKDMAGSPERVRIAIGPSICGKCFSVKEDFVDAVGKLLDKEVFDKFIIPDEQKAGVWHADLAEMNRYFLCLAGALPENIDVSGECGCCNPDRYFSHRYGRGERGTMLSVIEMPRVSPR